jgi:hypothetical protein
MIFPFKSPFLLQPGRKCVYDAAIQGGKTPGEAAAAAEAAARSVAWLGGFRNGWHAQNHPRTIG